jgi:hypothetical protein
MSSAAMESDIKGVTGIEEDNDVIIISNTRNLSVQSRKGMCEEQDEDVVIVTGPWIEDHLPVSN